MGNIYGYTIRMGKRDKAKLARVYQKYRIGKKKRNMLDFFSAFMPEIIFRTTRLEGERITRKKVSTLFK